MGDFGIHLYENDFVLDVKESYEEGLRNKVNNVELTRQMIEQYSNEIDDYYQMLFWVVLADIQWINGKLLDNVKEKALDYLNNDDLLDSCLNEIGALKDKRKTELLEIKKRISIPQHNEKTIRNKVLYKCEWSVGDVFEYQFHSADSKEYDGYFIYFVKCDEETWYPGHICPIIYLYAGLYKERKELSELNSIEFLPTPLVRALDKNENKYEYRILLLSTSKRVIPSKHLRYIGHTKIRENIKEKVHSSRRPLKWKDLELYFVSTWKSWNDCFVNGQMVEEETHKFRGRIPEDEDCVRAFYNGSNYHTDSDVRRWITENITEDDTVRLYPYLWSFSVVMVHCEFHDSDRWNGARYQLLRCEAKDLLFDYEDGIIELPESVKEQVYIDIYTAHHKKVYYCDFFEEFLCKSYYDKKKNIYVVGNPEATGKCIEFAQGQYVIIAGTKIHAFFVDLNVLYESG